jgi:hypothetical protein
MRVYHNLLKISGKQLYKTLLHKFFAFLCISRIQNLQLENFSHDVGSRSIAKLIKVNSLLIQTPLGLWGSASLHLSEGSLMVKETSMKGYMFCVWFDLIHLPHSLFQVRSLDEGIIRIRSAFICNAQASKGLTLYRMSEEQETRDGRVLST